MTVELYHFWSSVCSVRARMALEEKGVQWESRYIDLFNFDQMTPEYLAINPDGVVPTLVHDGEAVHESSVIIDFVDDAFDGPSLKPSDALHTARVREFMKLCDDKFSAIVLPTFVKYLLPKLKNRWGADELQIQAQRRPTEFYQKVHGDGINGAISDDDIEKCHDDIQTILDRMEAMLAEEAWLVGNQLTLADITVAPYMFRLLALGLDGWWAPDVRPRVGEWYKRVAALPSYQTAVNWPDETGGGYEEVGLTTKR